MFKKYEVTCIFTNRTLVYEGYEVADNNHALLRLIDSEFRTNEVVIYKREDLQVISLREMTKEELNA